MKKHSHYFISLIFLFVIIGCSSSTKFSKEELHLVKGKGTLIRVLIDESSNLFNIPVKNQIIIKDENRTIAVVKNGNNLKFLVNKNRLLLQINNRNFTGDYFLLQPKTANQIIKYHDKKYKGIVKVAVDKNQLKMINILPLEEYLKGVIPSEMPMGNGNEYFEALKAFTICARTYAYIKMNENKPLFDVFTDTQDQVYSGSNVEHPLANKAIAETEGMILQFGNNPAATFYHSTCGGYTENSANVFTSSGISYLKGIRDGNTYCSISPYFRWTEIYSVEEFLNRFKGSELISDSVEILTSVQVVSRFNSGRINELKIKFINDQLEEDSVSIFGNNIRSIIRNSDKNSILRSSNFEIIFDDDKIILNGKGFGHGVGMCQWGALFQSTIGKSYKEILQHYYPGTEIWKYD